MRTKVWDPAEHLHSPEAVLAYVEAALEDGDPTLLTAALSDVVRAHGALEIARTADLPRERVEQLMSPDARPDLGTVMRIMRALGLRLTATMA